MLPWILLAIAVVLLFAIPIIAMQPKDFAISRSLVMQASPEEAFEQVNVLKNWEQWSPWLELDRNAKNTYEGPASGPGAKFAWDGNKKVGAGSLTVIDTKPNQSVRIRLDFLRPFKGTNVAEFTFNPQGTNTEVTWTMLGERNFFMKAMGLMINCDKMIAPHFEKGLRNMSDAIKRTATKAA